MRPYFRGIGFGFGAADARRAPFALMMPFQGSSAGTRPPCQGFALGTHQKPTIKAVKERNNAPPLRPSHSRSHGWGCLSVGAGYVLGSRLTDSPCRVCRDERKSGSCFVAWASCPWSFTGGTPVPRGYASGRQGRGIAGVCHDFAATPTGCTGFTRCSLSCYPVVKRIRHRTCESEH